MTGRYSPTRRDWNGGSYFTLVGLGAQLGEGVGLGGSVGEGVGSGEGVGVGLADGLGNGVAVAPGTTTAEASGAAGMVTGDDGGEGGPRQSCCDGTTT